MAIVKRERAGLSAIMSSCIPLFRFNIWVGTGAKKPVDYGVLTWKPVKKAPLSADKGNQVSWREKMRRMQIVYID